MKKGIKIILITICSLFGLMILLFALLLLNIQWNAYHTEPSEKISKSAAVNPEDIKKMEKLSLFKSPEAAVQFNKAYNDILAHWPVPYEELYISTSFGMTHIIASGSKSAKPLILMHSMLSTAAVWLPNAEALSKHYRIYAIDVIGEPNKSESVRPVKSRKEFAQWLLEVFDGLKIKRVSIVGNSFGGFLSLNQVLYTPDRIEKIILISPAATFSQIWPFYFHMFFPMITGSDESIRKAIDWANQGIAPDKGWSDMTLVIYKNGIPANRVYPVVFKKEELQHVKHPSLLLIGDREVIYEPEKTLRKAKEMMPVLQCEIVPNANHMAAMSNPEYVNKRIIQFLESN